MTDIADFDLKSRLLAIAMNAIQESVIAHGRGDKPFYDDDARRMDIIFNTLHVSTQVRSSDNEHDVLVEANQPPIHPALLQISDLLEHAPDRVPTMQELEQNIIAEAQISKARAKR